MIGDHWRDKWQPEPWFTHIHTYGNLPQGVTKEEFDALKKDVEDLKKLLARAKEYDAKNGEPDCEIDSKMAVLRKVAEAVGVDLDEVLKKESG